MSESIVNSIYNRISQNLKQNQTQSQLANIILKYMDKNNEVLNFNLPSKRLYFNDETDRNPIYKLTGIEKNEIKNIVNSIPEVKSSWKLINDPFNILMIVIIRYFSMNKNNRMVELTLTYLTLSLYASLQYKMFPYLPNESVMEYTFNNLSEKYYFKKYKTVIKALMATAENNHEKYSLDLIKKEDSLIINYFVSLRSRLNNQMRIFANAYYIDYKEGNTIFNTSDSYDEDDYRENSNISSYIITLSDKITINFSTDNLDDQSIKVASSIAKVDKATLQSALISIKKIEGKNIKKLISLILQVYLKDNKNSINSVGSKKFFSYVYEVYSKSNTKDKTVLDIKDILDVFLNKHSNKYSKTERAATKGAYRKALYLYFVLIIMNYAN